MKINVVDMLFSWLYFGYMNICDNYDNNNHDNYENSNNDNNNNNNYYYYYYKVLQLPYSGYVS